MKKLLFIFVLLSALCLTGCTEYVNEIREEKKSWGVEYTFFKVDATNNYTFYHLLVPDFYKEPRFYHESLKSGSMDFSDRVIEDNCTVGKIVRVDGKIKSIEVNGQKYELLK